MLIRKLCGSCRRLPATALIVLTCDLSVVRAFLSFLLLPND
ncbi:hypothetical protein Hsw_1902 [Hymenobacter swuensis DY53]|uniref:Uncharacterized protein n=1 Tax=Hymenobacter swuensis DY53 TaxID=1227739 RepID=W8F0H7_9BACT|nr:hypothetical protein Hsw_1902 [Hymenobacter swuensis DY53]